MKKKACILGRLSFDEVGKSQTKKLLSWHFYASNDLKKYSYVTCMGEQSPSKFDTHSCQVKSTFGWEADLNTLTVRNVKSTFGTKRLMLWNEQSFLDAGFSPCLQMERWRGTYEVGCVRQTIWTFSCETHRSSSLHNTIYWCWLSTVLNMCLEMSFY